VTTEAAADVYGTHNVKVAEVMARSAETVATIEARSREDCAKMIAVALETLGKLAMIGACAISGAGYFLYFFAVRGHP
jgi:hypothetical protein